MPNSHDFTRIVEYLLSLSANPKQLHRALDGLLSTNEQQELCQRLRIFELLSEGVPQREVAKRLGVGIATVSRGSKALQAGNYVPAQLPAELSKRWQS